MTKANTTNIKPPKTLRSEITSLVLVVLLALTFRTLVVELFYVPTGSMKATILEGDYIFSTKYSYGYSIYSIPFNPDLFPDRILANQPIYGDIIIMRPPHNMEERYIKRLIGLPRDKVEVRNDATYLNDQIVPRIEVGEHINEDGTIYLKFKETLPNGQSFFTYKEKYPKVEFDTDHINYGPHIVAEGNYFFMGDNRDNSGDSRYQLGTVPFRNLIAKSQFILFSTKEPLWDSKAGIIEQIGRVWVWLSSIRFDRLFNNLYDK